jgi:hypothetical protein
MWPYEQRVMLASHPGGFSSVCEWYPSVSCQRRWEIHRAVTSRQPAFGKPFAAASHHTVLIEGCKEAQRLCAGQGEREQRHIRTAGEKQCPLSKTRRQATFVSPQKISKSTKKLKPLRWSCDYLLFSENPTWALGPVKPIIAKQIYMTINEYVQSRDAQAYFLNQRDIKKAYVLCSSYINYLTTKTMHLHNSLYNGIHI